MSKKSIPELTEIEVATVLERKLLLGNDEIITAKKCLVEICDRYSIKTEEKRSQVLKMLCSCFEKKLVYLSFRDCCSIMTQAFPICKTYDYINTNNFRNTFQKI